MEIVQWWSPLRLYIKPSFNGSLVFLKTTLWLPHHSSTPLSTHWRSFLNTVQVIWKRVEGLLHDVWWVDLGLLHCLWFSIELTINLFTSERFSQQIATIWKFWLSNPQIVFSPKKINMEDLSLFAQNHWRES